MVDDLKPRIKLSHIVKEVIHHELITSTHCESFNLMVLVPQRSEWKVWWESGTEHPW